MMEASWAFLGPPGELPIAILVTIDIIIKAYSPSFEAFSLAQGCLARAAGLGARWPGFLGGKVAREAGRQAAARRATAHINIPDSGHTLCKARLILLAHCTLLSFSCASIRGISNFLDYSN